MVVERGLECSQRSLAEFDQPTPLTPAVTGPERLVSCRPAAQPHEAAHRGPCQVHPWCASICAALLVCALSSVSWGDSSWEITPQSRKALDRGLQWLQRNQGPEGNWTTQ